jgi:hypothetical protein
MIALVPSLNLWSVHRKIRTSGPAPYSADVSVTMGGEMMSFGKGLHREADSERSQERQGNPELRIGAHAQGSIQRVRIQLDLLQQPRLHDSRPPGHSGDAAQCGDQLFLVRLLHDHVEIGDREGIVRY